MEAVNRYADKSGYDAIRFSDGEIVVKNPKAMVASEKPRPGMTVYRNGKQLIVNPPKKMGEQ